MFRKTRVSLDYHETRHNQPHKRRGKMTERQMQPQEVEPHVLAFGCRHDKHPKITPALTKRLGSVGGGELFKGVESMAMKFHGNVRGGVRVNFLAFFASKPTFSCAAPSNCPEQFTRTFA